MGPRLPVADDSGCCEWIYFPGWANAEVVHDSNTMGNKQAEEEANTLA